MRKTREGGKRRARPEVGRVREERLCTKVIVSECLRLKFVSAARWSKEQDALGYDSVGRKRNSLEEQRDKKQELKVDLRYMLVSISIIILQRRRTGEGAGQVRSESDSDCFDS